MNYLFEENISKSFGERTLFENISFKINKDQKNAIIAKNGSGKTTTQGIINGLDDPDTGPIVLKKGIEMTFLPHNNLQDALSIEESFIVLYNETLKVIFIYKTMETKKDFCLCHT
jgi:ATP-binding cassette subfamily F protein uup